MKKVKVKAKTSKKSTKSSALEQQGLLDLVSAMAKIAERLEGLEKKTEQVIRQISTGFSGMMSSAQNVQRSESSHGSQGHRPPYQNSNQNHVSQQNNNRHERVMYKAICADCRKGCEVPFKPTGERPIYCKECFAKRKADYRGPTTVESRVPLHQQNSGQVAALANMSSKAKSIKPGKKSKK